MSNLSFEEKIKELKRMHARSHPDALKQVYEWEEQYARIKASIEWLQHPETKNLRKMAQEQIKIIDNELSQNKDITMEARNFLWSVKEAHLVYLAVLSIDPQSEMDSIESAVDGEL